MKTERTKSSRWKTALRAGLISAAFYPQPGFSAPQADEQALIAQLQSTATLQQKDAACASLKRVATARAVPTLSALLTDPDLSHSARYALESMLEPEAGPALAAALDETTGLLKVGVIESLARRRESAAAAKLISLIDDPDTTVATAAIRAAGHFATSATVEALLRAHSGTQGTQNAGMRAAVEDSLLACAEQLRLAGERAPAESLYQKLSDPLLPAHIRLAACRGLILSAPPHPVYSSTSPDPALGRLVSALQRDDEATRKAALQLARTIQSPDSTLILSRLAGTLPQAGVRIALIEALRQRGDVQAVPALITATADPDAAVRIAAIGALGDLGGASAVEPLVEAVTSSSKEEGKAARQALLDLRQGEVTGALLQQLAGGRPAVQRAAVRALIGRSERDAVGKMLALARDADDPTRKAALGAVIQLARVEDVPALVALLSAGKDAAGRAQAGSALAKICVRLADDGGRINAEPIVSAFAAGDPQTRIALLPTAAVVRDTRLRDELRKALKSPETPVREAAIQALGDARDPELLPDLLALAKGSDDPAVRVPALRGYLRLATGPSNPPRTPEQRVEALRELIPVARRPQEKWAILGELAETSSSKALELALPMLEDPEIRAEAAQAVTKIAAAISAENPHASRAALQRVLAVATDTARREAATAALDQISTSTSPASAPSPDSI